MTDTTDAHQQRLSDLGVPTRMAELIVNGSVDSSAAVLEVRRWLASEKLVLVLHGPYDSGKTVAASVAVETASASSGGSAARFVDVAVLLGPWENLGPSTFDPITKLNKEQLLTCCCLVIDSLGFEFTHEREDVLEALETLLLHRCCQGLRTLLISNHRTPTEVAAHLDDGRLGRFGRCIENYGVYFHCPFEGYRRRMPQG